MAFNAFSPHTNHPRLDYSDFIISTTSSATMSIFEFLDFSLCDPSPPDMALAIGEDLSIGQFLEPLPSAFDPLWLPGPELAGGASSSCSSLSVDLLEGQHSTTQAPSDATVWVSDLIGSTGFFPPLASEIVHETPKPFDGEIPVEDTSSEDIQRYIERTGKVPYFNVFAPEEEDFDALVYPDSENLGSDEHVETPSTPVRRRVASTPKRRKQLTSRSSSVTASDPSDHSPSPLKNRASTKKAAGSSRTTKIKVPKAAVLQEPKDEPPAKKAKGRKTFNSACAADDLAHFAPVLTPTQVAPPVAAPSTFSSPLTSLSDSSDTETPTPSYPRKAVANNRKRKFKDIDRDEDFNPSDNEEDNSLEFIPVKQERKKQPQTSSDWIQVDESYSQRRSSSGMQYRCNLCFVKDTMHLCTREGDMTRHLQSLKHAAKSFFCSNSRCSSGFTREDALKRHMRSCKA